MVCDHIVFGVHNPNIHKKSQIKEMNSPWIVLLKWPKPMRSASNN